MRLVSFSLGEKRHVSLQDFIDVINRFVDEEEYVIKIVRGKIFKKDNINDVVYVSCDRDKNLNRNSKERK